MIKNTYKKKHKITIIIIIIVLVIVIGLYFFPIYRLSELSNSSAGISFYTKDEIKKCLYIGSMEDRREAKKILKVAETAITDTTNTQDQCKKLYGELYRYVPPRDEKEGYKSYRLDLWSAHLEETEGYIWVYYELNPGYNQTSLWKVAKKQGKWVVTNIKEFP